MKTDVGLCSYSVFQSKSHASTPTNSMQKTHLEALIPVTITAEVKYVLIAVSLDLSLAPILI
jgi:hypothetical protein